MEAKKGIGRISSAAPTKRDIWISIQEKFCRTVLRALYRLKCACELKDRISKFKIHLSYGNGYVGEIFSIHWKT